MMSEEPIKANVSFINNKLYLYGTIGDRQDGITLDDVKRTVKDMDKSKVTIYINSYGGDSTEGIAIYHFLIKTFITIEVFIDGIAASAASIIAMCGQTLTMPKGTIFMIQNPWTLILGNRKDLLKEVSALEAMEQSYRDIYMNKFTDTEEELSQLMADESWLTAEQAVELGFADKEVQENEVRSGNDNENLFMDITKLALLNVLTEQQDKLRNRN